MKGKFWKITHMDTQYGQLLNLYARDGLITIPYGPASNYIFIYDVNLIEVSKIFNLYDIKEVKTVNHETKNEISLLDFSHGRQQTMAC